MNDTEFEDRYLDVLQNIEIGITRIYQKDPETTDLDALSAVESLLRRYNAEARNRLSGAVRPPDRAGLLYDSIAEFTEWRLGRARLTTLKNPSEPPTTVTVAEMIACLKRIRKSIEFWNRANGRRGYLDFMTTFVR